MDIAIKSQFWFHRGSSSYSKFRDILNIFKNVFGNVNDNQELKNMLLKYVIKAMDLNYELLGRFCFQVP